MKQGAAFKTEQFSETGISQKTIKEIGVFAGQMISKTNALKLVHWHITGKGSYAAHIALDTAIEAITGYNDRVVETTYGYAGDISIIIPETNRPENIIEFVEEFYKYIGDGRHLFQEAFTQSIFDEYQEALAQLLYRLKRLS